MDEKKQRLQNLINFSVSIRESFHSSMQRISEQKTEHLALIASISAAILAIITAFPSEKNIWIDISFWSLFATVIVGTFLILLIVHIREETTISERSLAITVLDNLKDSTKNAIEQGSEYDVQHKEDFDNEIERIRSYPNKYEGARLLLNLLYWMVLGSFFLGMICLAAYWLEKGGVSINMNLISLISIFIVSIFLGIIKFYALGVVKDKNRSWQLNFAEIWNCSWNFIIAGFVGYYFALYRWPAVTTSQRIEFTDIWLFVIFAMGIFGHLNVLSKNVSEGIQAIFKKFFE